MIEYKNIMELPFMTILPLLSMLFVVALGIFIYFQNRTSKLNILFGWFTIVMSIWFFGTFKMFTSNEDVEAIFWDRFIYAGVVFIPALIYHFSIVFTKIKGKKYNLIFAYIVSLFFLIMSRTDYFVSGLFKYTWGVHTQAKLFHHLFLVTVAILFFLTLRNLYRYYKKNNLLNIERLQAKYVFFAFFVLIVISLPAFAPAYQISVFPLFYISGLIFSVILAYAILKHHLMDIRVIATEFFVGTIAFILLIDFFLADSLSESLFQLGIFIGFCFVGWQLIKSVLNEIERREQLEELTKKLKKTYEKLKTANKAKSEFLSIASHQLRTPLTAVKGYISLILEESYGKIPEKIIQPLKNVFQSNERLLVLVNNLLDLSRLEAEKIELTLSPMFLEKLILNIVEELKVNADKKGLYINTEKPLEPLPEISADKDKLRQVILNIIDNAIKYTKNGGITIKMKKTPLTEKVLISDTGDGMTEQEISNVFQMFTRATAGMKNHTGGSGVGLYVAKKFVDMHNGKIWIESQGKGKGTTFNIELPIKQTKNDKNTKSRNN